MVMVIRIGMIYPRGSNEASVWILEFDMKHLKKGRKTYRLKKLKVLE